MDCSFFHIHWSLIFLFPSSNFKKKLFLYLSPLEILHFFYLKPFFHEWDMTIYMLSISSSINKTSPLDFSCNLHLHTVSSSKHCLFLFIEFLLPLRKVKEKEKGTKTQSVVAHSTFETKCRAMTTSPYRVCLLLHDLGTSLSDPTPMFCDNKSAIQIASNSIFHKKC